MAPAAHKAEAIKANLAVAFGGAIRLKPKKITTSQTTTTVSIGVAMDALREPVKRKVGGWIYDRLDRAHRDEGRAEQLNDIIPDHTGCRLGA
jgi:hypothetical protein